jgi:SAM-dependent methyltransferase
METDAYRQMREAEETHWWFRGRKAILSAAVRRALGTRRPKRILDLGCGVGGMMDFLSDLGSVFGTDTSFDSVAYCKGRGVPLVFTSSGTALPLAGGSFDLVTAFDTIEHIPDDEATVRECFRILRPGGLLVVSGPAYQFLYSHQDRVVHHQRRYTLGSLKRVLLAAGFSITRGSYYNLLLFPAILPALLLIKAKQRILRPPLDSTETNVSLPIPRVVNRLLEWVFKLERFPLAAMDFPAGHSLFVVGEKPQRMTQRVSSDVVATGAGGETPRDTHAR